MQKEWGRIPFPRMEPFLRSFSKFITNSSSIQKLFSSKKKEEKKGSAPFPSSQ
jgi:hypothetical protein